MNKIIKEKLKQVLILFIIIVAFGTVLSIMLRYESEGEQNMPFTLSEMILASSVDEMKKEENPDNVIWNLDINQYNDIYLKFDKNPEYKESTYIDSITIENINYETADGNNIVVYMPNSTDEKRFSYEENFVVNNSLTYKGGSQDNIKSLEVNKDGGRILFRVVNQRVGEFVFNQDDEIAYDGTLLKKIGIPEEKLKIKMSFDIVIKTNSKKYRGNIKVDLPSGNILEEGMSKVIKTDLSEVTFKRENY